MSSATKHCICTVCAAAQTPDHLKTPTAEEAFNPNGLSQRTIRLLKDAFPDVEVRTLLTLYQVWQVHVKFLTLMQLSATHRLEGKKQLPWPGCSHKPDGRLPSLGRSTEGWRCIARTVAGTVAAWV